MTKRRVVLSLEQAVALPYATLRFRQLGWRVIRIEATGSSTRPGDPNRYAGRLFADEGRRSFFVPPNVGKEAIALNLKAERGQELLRRLIERLQVDVFCCNLLPAHHAGLGVDYAALKAAREDIIWASISAMGTEHPDVPGYDPVIQAMSGLMSMPVALYPSRAKYSDNHPGPQPTSRMAASVGRRNISTRCAKS